MKKCFKVLTCYPGVDDEKLVIISWRDLDYNQRKINQGKNIRIRIQIRIRIKIKIGISIGTLNVASTPTLLIVLRPSRWRSPSQSRIQLLEYTMILPLGSPGYWKSPTIKLFPAISLQNLDS